jgi:hypothetical protein
MRGLIWALLAVLPAGAQTMYLRYGGPMSRAAISGASQTTPVEITTASPHGFANGEIVWISQVRGNFAANGVRRVRSSGATSFAIEDLQGQPVAASGAYAGSGFVGRARETTLTGHPRFLADGPNGAVTRRIWDPDGPGGQAAPNAVSGWAPYDALVSRMDARARNPDGFYGGPAARPDSNDVQAGDTVHQMALAWAMDQSRGNYLAAVKRWINEFHRLFTWPGFTAIDPNDRSYGLPTGSLIDWGSFFAANWAMGYSLIRDRLSPAEREAFAAKMLNDTSDDCAGHIGFGEGRVSVETGSTRVRGTGTRFRRLEPGQYIRIPNAPLFQRWVTIASIESDTELTTGAPALTTSPGVAEGAWFHTRQWTPQTCGVKWWLNHHGYTPSSPSMQWRVDTRLVDAVDAAAPAFRIRSGGDLLAFRLPFYGQLPGAADNNFAIERFGVTAADGDLVTAERGGRASTAIPAAANRMIFFHQIPIHSNLMTTNWQWTRQDEPRHNLTFTKVYGYLAIGAALCGDDVRACRLLEETWNYFYDFMYPYMKDFWTGINQGGYSYGPARWGEWSMSIAQMAKSSFQPPIDITDGQWLRSWLHHGVYMTTPYRPTFGFRYADSGGAEEMYPRHYRGIFTGNHLFAGTPEAGHALHWFREEAQWFTPQHFSASTGFNAIPWPLYFITPQTPSIDYKTSAKPYRFFTETDIDWKEDPARGGKTGFFGVVSRSNWRPSATHLWISSFARPNDHLCVWSAAGHYYILKNHYLIANQGQGTLAPGCMTGGGTGTNYVEVGGSPSSLATNAPNAAGGIGPVPPVDRTHAGENYLLARVDARWSQRVDLHITRLFRTFVHLRNGDQPDYIVVHDDAATSRARRKRIRMWHFSDGNEDAPLRNLGPGAYEFTRQRAKVTSQWLLPSDPGKFSELTPVSYRGHGAQTEWSKGYMVDDGESAETAFLVVHRAADDINAPMPAVELLREVSGGALGVSIADAVPRTVILQANGDAPLSEVSFQTAAYAGAGVVVVTGLAPGTYTVARDGSAVASGVRVAGHGSLEVAGPAGRYTVARTGRARAELKLNPAGLSFLHRAGSAIPDPQPVRVTCPDCLVSVTGSEPWCMVDPRQAVAPFDARVSVMPQGFAAGDYSCRLEFSSPEADNSPLALEVALAVSETNSIGVTPSLLEMEHTLGEPAPEPKRFTADCLEPCRLAVAANQDWCVVEPAEGDSPLEFKISVNVDALAAGEHECVVAVSAAGIPDPAQARLVVRVIEPPPPPGPDGLLARALPRRGR